MEKLQSYRNVEKNIIITDSGSFETPIFCVKTTKIPILLIVLAPDHDASYDTIDNLIVSDKIKYLHANKLSFEKEKNRIYGNNYTNKDKGKLINIVHKNIKHSLSVGEDVIYDVTGLDKKYVRGLLRELDRFDCMKVSLCVVNFKRHSRTWEPPSLSDGFDDIYILDRTYSGMDEYYTIFNYLYGDFQAYYIDQRNSHHSKTIGDHCLFACFYANSVKPCDHTLHIACLLHDIGKLGTRSQYNSKGVDDGDYHYYDHEKYGGYESLLYTKYLKLSTKDRIDVSNLIYRHMLFYTNNKSDLLKKLRNEDDDFIERLNILHEADINAR